MVLDVQLKIKNEGIYGATFVRILLNSDKMVKRFIAKILIAVNLFCFLGLMSGINY
jgi:hypothetical protein